MFRFLSLQHQCDAAVGFIFRKKTVASISVCQRISVAQMSVGPLSKAPPSTLAEPSGNGRNVHAGSDLFYDQVLNVFE